MFRVGLGYDVHRLVAGRMLVLGGVSIPHDRGCLGHSDADVLLHAICDALLGAAALGDIGRHFPDSDVAYKDISSVTLIDLTRDKIQTAGWKVGNVDCTLVLQEPKIAPYVGEMVAVISSHLKIASNCVSIKATTSEGLGFIGSGEGVVAYAIAMLVKP